MSDPHAIRWTFAVVGGTVLLSIPIALILADDFIGRQVLRVIIMLPWAVSLTISRKSSGVGR